MSEAKETSGGAFEPPIDEEALSFVYDEITTEDTESKSATLLEYLERVDGNRANFLQHIGEFANRIVDTWQDFSTDEQNLVSDLVKEELGIDLRSPDDSLLIGESQFVFSGETDLPKEKVQARIYKTKNPDLLLEQQGLEPEGENFRVFLKLSPDYLQAMEEDE